MPFGVAPEKFIVPAPGQEPIRVAVKPPPPGPSRRRARFSRLCEAFHVPAGSADDQAKPGMPLFGSSMPGGMAQMSPLLVRL